MKLTAQAGCAFLETMKVQPVFNLPCSWLASAQLVPYAALSSLGTGLFFFNQ